MESDTRDAPDATGGQEHEASSQNSKMIRQVGVGSEKTGWERQSPQSYQCERGKTVEDEARIACNHKGGQNRRGRRQANRNAGASD